MTDVKVRLHLDKDMDAEPVATIIVPSPLPVIIKREDELTGLVVEYELKKRHLKSPFTSDEDTADYVYRGLA